MIPFKEVLDLKHRFNSQTTDLESMELYNGVLKSPKGEVVEVGSASGGTTIVLICSSILCKKHVYSIDPYPEELEDIASHYSKGIMSQRKEEFKTNILNGSYKNITQFNNYVQDCIDKIPNNLSMIFIDSCHELDFVKEEISLLLPKLTIGGFLYVHDTNWKIGQLSKTPENGLVNIYEWIKSFPLKDIKTVDSMLRGIKI
jgi:hypothetical protein